MFVPRKESYSDKWADIVVAKPRLVFLIASVFITASTIISFLIPKDLSFTGFLGANDPDVIAFNEAFETFGAYSMLLALVEGPPEALPETIKTLQHELPRNSPARTVLPPADPQWFKDRAPWLWPDPIFNSVIKDIEAGTDSAVALNSVNAADTYIQNLLVKTDKAAILSIEIESSPLDMSVGGAHFKMIEAEAKRLVADLNNGTTVEFTGLAAVGGQDQGAVVSRIIYLTPLTVIGVLLLVFLIEPRVSRVILAGVALAGSVLIGLAVVGLIQERITLGSAFFGLLLLGLGIDFGIHLLVAMRDSRFHGLTPDESVHKAMNATAEPIVLGAASSALAFGVIMLIPHSLTRDMGLTAFFGVLLAMIMMLSLLPAGWLMLERRIAHKETPAKLSIPLLEPAVRLSIRYPKLVLGAGLVLALIGAAGIPRYKSETDLEKIFSRNVPALEVARRIEELFDTGTTSYTAKVESLQQAAEWKEELLKLDCVASVSSPTDILNDNAETRLPRMQQALANHPDTELARRIQTALDTGPITLESIPPWLGSGILSEDYEMAIHIVPVEHTLDAAILDKEIEIIRAVAPTATGVPVIVRMATMGLSQYVPYMVPMVFVVVTLTLVVAFRDVQGVLLSLLPVVVATSITFGFYFWFDMQFSTLTVVVVPVILGLGVDDGIHIVERLRRYTAPTKEQLQEAVVGVGRPIFLTTTTTCVSFIALLFTDHSGLESIAKFMLVGVPLCFVTSVTMVPAAAMLFIIPRTTADAKPAEPAT